MYQGSYSTPNCDEIVTYVVDQNIHSIDTEQLDILTDFLTNFRSSKGNNREI